MKWFCCGIAWLLLGVPLFAQQANNAGEVIRQVMERIVESGGEGIDYTEEQSRLEYLAAHKIDLNGASAEMLRELMFLSEQDIQAIITHRNLYGDFISVYELQSISLLNDQTILFLFCFVTVNEMQFDDPVSLPKMVASGRHEIQLLYDADVESKKGYKPSAETGYPAYRGMASRQLIRYRFNYKNRLQFGVVGETDKGEAYAFNKQQWGFDYLGFYFSYRPRKSIVQMLAVGDYQLCFGQGLMLNNGMAARRGTAISSAYLSQPALKPYKSINEMGAWRGGAVWLGKKRFQSLLFYSNRALSATITNNTANEVGTVSESGMHRTQTEYANRSNLNVVLFGGRVMYNQQRLQLAVQCASTVWNRFFAIDSKPYKWYQPQGNRFTNVGADVKVPWRLGIWFGEWVMDNHYALAMLYGGIFTLGKKVDMVGVYRRYSKDFVSVGGNAFGAYYNLCNEEGLYTGLFIKLNSRWHLGLNQDLFRSFWLRYRKDIPERAVWHQAALNYQPDKLTQIQLRYVHQQSITNVPNDAAATNMVSPVNASQYRVQCTWQPSAEWLLRSRVDEVIQESLGNRQTGWLLFQELQWKAPSGKLSVTGMVTLFKTADGVLMYVAESDVPYQYNLSVFQGAGVRYCLLARLRLTHGLDFWLRYAQTAYEEVSAVGSGLEEINGHVISGFRVMLSAKLP